MYSNDESDDDNDEEVDPIITGLYKVRCSLHGDALAKFDFLMETVASRDETVEGLESHIENEKRRFNLLKQELSDEKNTSFLLKQQNVSYELEKEKSINDACATNSTSCEASTFKENVELRAQLELLTSNYRKLEESHEKLSSSHNDLIISYDGLKLSREASITKVTSCEPHLDISTTSTQNVILPCASHTIDTTYVGLLSLPCCSNNEASTSSSTCIATNHVEEIKELKSLL